VAMQGRECGGMSSVTNKLTVSNRPLALGDRALAAVLSPRTPYTASDAGSSRLLDINELRRYGPVSPRSSAPGSRPKHCAHIDGSMEQTAAT
jgi:hypothetical protein